jgi:biotin carboxyl carrier protein
VPNYDILINGKPRKVEITRKGQGSFLAKLDEKSRRIELPATTPNFEQRFEIKVDGKTYNIELPRIEQGKPVPIKVEEAAFKVEVMNPRNQTITTFRPTIQTPTRKVSLSKQAIVAEGAVTAPMTGKIVSVRVKKGDQVKRSQVLCVIEAMKMENEITATKDGTVREVNCSEGSPVNEGDTLFVIS